MTDLANARDEATLTCRPVLCPLLDDPSVVDPPRRAAPPDRERDDVRTGRGRRIWYPWQARGLARVSLLRAAWMSLVPDGAAARNAVHFDQLLAQAEWACTTRPSFTQRLSGAAVESAWTHVHAAEALLVASCRAEVLPSVVPRAADLTRVFDADSPQRQAVAALTQDLGPDRSTLTVALAIEAAHGRRDSHHDRARSFRNIVVAAALLVGVAVLSLVVLAVAAPTTLPMCAADSTACLLGEGSRTLDVPVVTLVGAAAGTLSGIAALRRLRGTATPYQVPLALAALKIPTGALTAVLGLLLLRAGLAGTTFAPTSSAGLLGWAVVLGLAQEVVTRLADRQGELVLDTIKAPAASTPAAARG